MKIHSLYPKTILPNSYFLSIAIDVGNQDGMTPSVQCMYWNDV